MPRDPFTSNNEESVALRAWEIIRRRRLLAFIISATLVASAASFARYLPDLYQASAMVLVERQLSETYVRPAVSGELESRLHVIKQETLSRARLTDLVERFDLYPELRSRGPMEPVLDQASHDIEIELTGPEQVAGRTKTVAFRLSYTGESRETVADVTNAIAAFYVAQNDRMRSDEATRTTDFLKAQLIEAKKALDRHEGTVRAYTSRHIGELPQQVGVNLATLERLNDQLRLNGEQQLRVLEQREKLLEGFVLEPGLPLTVATPAAPADLSDAMRRLEQMKQDLQDMETRFTAKHPDVLRLRDQVAALERDIADRENAARIVADSAQRPPEPPRAVPVARRRALEGLDAELERLKKAEAEVRLSIATIERRLESAPERQQEFALLSRDYQASKDLYDSLSKRHDEAQLAESMETDRQGERFRILEPALAPEGPIAPNRLRLLILGLLLAAAATVAGVILAEQIDTSFHSVDELRAFTKVPVLASIPRIGPVSGRHRARLVVATASALAAIAVIAAWSAHVASGNEQLVRLLVRAS